MPSNYYEVIIIGGGTAGLSAASTLVRARRHTLIIDNHSPRNRTASHLHGYLTRESFSPSDFLKTAQSEVAAFGGEFLSGTVTTIRINNQSQPRFSLSVGSKEQLLHADALLVTTGLTDQLPNICGLKDLWGQVVHHCSYCHGTELDQSEPVAIAGGNNPTFILKQAKLLRQWVSQVVLVTNGMILDTETREDLSTRGITVLDDFIERVHTDEAGRCKLTNRSGQCLTVGALFVGPKFKPNDSLLRQAGCNVTPADWVEVDEHFRTSVPRIWAAGNVVSSPAQLIHAAAAGATAAISINDTLLGL